MTAVEHLAPETWRDKAIFWTGRAHAADNVVADKACALIAGRCAWRGEIERRACPFAALDEAALREEWLWGWENARDEAARLRAVLAPLGPKLTHAHHSAPAD